MGSIRIVFAAALSLLASTAPAQGLADSLGEFARAGFASASVDLPPVPLPQGRLSMRWSPCADADYRCYYDDRGILLFTVKYVYGHDAAVGFFPQLTKRQTAYESWAAAQDRLIAHGAFRRTLPREIDWKRPHISEIPDSAGHHGELTVRTLAIPLFSSRWRLLSLWAQLQKDDASSYTSARHPEQALANFRERGNLGTVVNQSHNEERARALVSALAAQGEYARLLSSLYSGYSRWETAAGTVDADHLEPGEVRPDIWLKLAGIAKSVDRLLDAAEAGETAMHLRWNTPVARSRLPAILSSAFFDNLDLPVVESEQARVDLIRDTMANKVENCGYGTCFYGEDGHLHHWVTAYQGGIYVTGYPDVFRRQTEFNEWARDHRRGYRPLFIPPSGGWGTETLKIPYYKAEFEIKEMWRRLADEARTAAPSARWPELEDYIARPTDSPLPDGSAAIRAEGVADAWRAAKAYEARVRALEPLSSRWAALGLAKDHLEPSQLSSGTSADLAQAEKVMRAAFEAARRIEELSR